MGFFKKLERFFSKVRRLVRKIERVATDNLPPYVWRAIQIEVRRQINKRIPGAEKAREVGQIVRNLYPHFNDGSLINLGIELAFRKLELERR